MNNMKLIMESWRGFSNNHEEQLIIESIDRFEKQMLKDLSRAERLDEGKIEDFVKGKLEQTFKYVKGLASKAGDLSAAANVAVYKMLEKLAKVFQSFEKRYPKIAKYGPVALAALGLLFFASGASAAGVGEHWYSDIGSLLDLVGSMDLSGMDPETKEYIEKFVEVAGRVAGEDGIATSDEIWSQDLSYSDRQFLQSSTRELQGIADDLASKAMEAAATAQEAGPDAPVATAVTQEMGNWMWSTANEIGKINAQLGPSGDPDKVASILQGIKDMPGMTDEVYDAIAKATGDSDSRALVDIGKQLLGR